MAQWTCPNCGRINESRFCAACGTEHPHAGAFTVTFETGKPYKVHSSYVWLGPIVATLAFVVIAALNSVSSIIQGIQALEESGIEMSPLPIIGISIVALLVLYGIVVALYALGYKNMSFVFDEREFSFYSGIITKRRVHLPYARVQSVNHRATIVQRLAGVCTVTIDSAGGSANKALRVPYLRLETAERMRVDLFIRKAAVEMGVEADVVYNPLADPTSLLGAQTEALRIGQERAGAPEAPVFAGVPGPAASGGVPVAAGVGGQAAPNKLDEIGGVVGEWRGVYGGLMANLGEASYEFGLTNRELALTSLSHATPVILAISIGLAAIVSVVGAVFVGDEVSRIILAMSVPVILGPALLSWLIGAASVAVSYGAFRARRRGSRIEVERGLLQRNFSGIDIARIQSVEIRQTFIRRLMGYCEISLGRISTGGDEAGNQNNSASTRGLVIHPFVKLDRVDEILDGLVPEFSEHPTEEGASALPAPALRRSILRRCVWYNWSLYVLVAVGVLVFIAGGKTGGLPVAGVNALNALIVTACTCFVVYTAGSAIGAVLWARESRYGWNRNYLFLHNSGLWVERTIIPRQKIQAGSTRDNPFQRRLSLTSIIATTAAGTSKTSARLLDVPADAGSAYLDWLKPRTR